MRPNHHTSSINLLKDVIFFKVIRILSFSISTFFFGFQTFSQPPVSLPVSILGLNEGVLHEGNYFCFKDSRDFLWMSSYAGLHRFDGKNIKVFTPVEQDSTSLHGREVVSHIHEDAETNLWFGTDRALNCFIRETAEFKNYMVRANSEGEYRVLGIDGNGKIWLTFEASIYTFNVKTHLFEQKATIDLNSLRGEVVLMTEFLLNEDKEVTHTLSYGSYLDDPGIEMHVFENDSCVRKNIFFFDSSQGDLSVRDVYSFQDSLLLIAALEGVYKFNLISQEFQKLLVNADQTEEVGCTGIAQFSDTTLILAMLNSEYLEYNHKTGKIEERYTFEYNGTRIEYQPKFISRDHTGGIYVHLTNRGLAYFHPKNILFKHRKYPFKETDASQFMTIGGCMMEVEDGKVFATSPNIGGLLLSRDGLLLETYQFSSPGGKQLPEQMINSCIKDSDGRIWLFHYDRYISRFDHRSNEMTSFQIENMVWGGLQLPSEELLMFPRKGLLIGTLKSPEETFIRKVTSADTTIQYSGMTLHSNGLVIGGEYKRSILAMDPDQNFKIVKRADFSHPLNKLEPIANSNDFLVPSFNGPYYFDAKTETVSLLDYCKCGTEADIYGFLPLGNQNYFSSSDRGVCTTNLLSKESTLYSLEHGLGLMKFNRGCIMLHSDGTIWLGNNNGITTCKSRHLDIPEFNNLVNIIGVSINDDPQLFPKIFHQSHTPIEEIKDIDLTYKFNTLSFQFAAFSYAGMNKQRYEHRLVGQEQEWVDGGDRGFARYPNLSPGEYTFEARVKNRPGSVRSILINITPPLWGRLWFRILLGLAILSGLYALFMLREKRKRHIQQLKFERRLALEQERVRIATDLHSISVFSKNSCAYWWSLVTRFSIVSF